MAGPWAAFDFSGLVRGLDLLASVEQGAYVLLPDSWREARGNHHERGLGTVRESLAMLAVRFENDLPGRKLVFTGTFQGMD